MSDAQPPAGIIGYASRLTDDLIRALPPAFLLLVLLNCFFLGLVMWFLNSQQEQRSSLINAVVDRCMEITLHPQPGK